MILRKIKPITILFLLVIHWLNSKLNNCEIVAKSSNNCGVLSETTNVTKNANVKSVEKFSTSTPANAETVRLIRHSM